ncbi:MAG: hypothetical protein NT098_03275 [Candidatus Parcubacteria bacterium]|nr:hypothetical protein [Candidatus Parcubacteria bacterium]
MKYKYKTLFDNSFKSDDVKAKEKYHKKIEEIGNIPHFVITKDIDGWFAQCQEVEAIITGGTNPNPTNEEIEEKVKEVLLTAFNISGKVTKKEEVPACGFGYRLAMAN